MDLCADGTALFREGKSSPREECRSAPQVLFPFFADLVALAGGLNPIPSRTRPLNSPAPMVLSLKAWKSRSLPGLQRTEKLLDTMTDTKNPPRKRGGFFCFCSISLFKRLPNGALLPAAAYKCRLPCRRCEGKCRTSD